jgi:hypothetical protein
MATFKVTAPAGGYDGKVGNVEFRDGCVEIDDERNPMELDYCRNAGYLVEPLDGDEDDERGDEQDPEDPEEPGVFDPAEHNADEVLAYLDQADETEATRVLDVEAFGKKRKGITDRRDAILASKKEESK